MDVPLSKGSFLNRISLTLSVHGFPSLYQSCRNSAFYDLRCVQLTKYCCIAPPFKGGETREKAGGHGACVRRAPDH